MFKCPYKDCLSYYRATYSITVKPTERYLYLIRDGKIYKSYPIGVGKMLTPTPKGNYTIINKAINPGGPFGARWMGLNKPHNGIHGTNNPSSIGKLVSHGCIRMYNKDVIELYNIVPIGTVVRIV